MKLIEPESLRIKAHAQFQETVNAAKAELHRQLAAIDTLRPLFGETSSSATKTDTKPDGSKSVNTPPQPQAVGITALIRQALPTMPRRFTVAELVWKVRKLAPAQKIERVYVSSAMHKLKEQNEVWRVGDNPVTYTADKKEAGE